MTGLLEPAIKVQIHLEAARTILESSLKWGTIGQVAAEASISRRYLYKLRQGNALPSREVAERIARSLPWPVERQRELLKQWLLARESSEALVGHAMQDLDWLRHDATGELIRAHEIATYSRTPVEARTYYGALHNLGRHLVDAFDEARLPLAAARAHTLLHDSMCVLNRPGAAFYHANVAEAILENMASSISRHQSLIYYDFRADRERLLEYDELLVNVRRTKAVAYNLLGHHTRASLICDRLSSEEAVKRAPADWRPHILRDKLDALSRDPGATAETIEEVARSGRTICEATDDKLGLLLVHNFSARGYVAREKYGKAKEALDHGSGLLDRFQNFGQLHKALFYSTLAAFHSAQDNEDEWRHYLSLALSTAQRADLVEVTQRLAREHGNHPDYREVEEQVAEIE